MRTLTKELNEDIRRYKQRIFERMGKLNRLINSLHITTGERAEYLEQYKRLAEDLAYCRLEIREEESFYVDRYVRAYRMILRWEDRLDQKGTMHITASKELEKWNGKAEEILTVIQHLFGPTDEVRIRALSKIIATHRIIRGSEENGA